MELVGRGFGEWQGDFVSFSGPFARRFRALGPLPYHVASKQARKARFCGRGGSARRSPEVPFPEGEAWPARERYLPTLAGLGFSELCSQFRDSLPRRRRWLCASQVTA